MGGCASVGEYKELETAHQKLAMDHAELEQTYEELADSYASLKAEQKALRDDLLAAIEEIDELQREHSDELAQIDNLQPEVRWQDYAEKAQIAYDKDDYPVAHAEFKKAIVAGCEDGIVWYRYSYSREQLFGLNQETLSAYETAFDFLSTQYSDHHYYQYAKNKLERAGRTLEPVSSDRSAKPPDLVGFRKELDGLSDGRWPKWDVVYGEEKNIVIVRLWISPVASDATMNSYCEIVRNLYDRYAPDQIYEYNAYLYKGEEIAQVCSW